MPQHPNSASPSDSEDVLYEGKLSWLPAVPSLVGAVLATSGGLTLLVAGDSSFKKTLGCVLIVLAFYWIGIPVLKRLAFRAFVTPHRIVVRRGLYSRNSSVINLNRIESIDVSQTIWQRLTGYGSVTLRGVGNEDVLLYDIHAPEEFKNRAFAALDELNGRAGML